MVPKKAVGKIPGRDQRRDVHGGTLIVDATCVPEDIAYPTDTGLLADDPSIRKPDRILQEDGRTHR